MNESNEFYDVKISQDIINEKEKNIITNRLIKNEEMRSNSIQSDTNRWCNNKCFFLSALIFSSTAIATGVYMCFI
jgi:hypothetical protein